jgi:dihydroxy-acid dehydratase
MKALELGIRPRDVLTFEAFENAITLDAAMGGSTNAVLHLLAIAREAGVSLTLDDFDRLARKTPHIVSMKPAGAYVMADLHRAGGVPVVLRRLLDAGRLHGDALTVTGVTLSKNLESARTRIPGNIVRTFEDPISPAGGLAILRGNLAPDGAVVKSAGVRRLVHQGPARVFESEDAAFQDAQDGRIHAGDVVIVRYEGPKGGPGMREMLAVTAALVGQGLGEEVALATDGRSFGTGMSCMWTSPDDVSTWTSPSPSSGAGGKAGKSLSRGIAVARSQSTRSSSHPRRSVRCASKAGVTFVGRSPRRPQ